MFSRGQENIKYAYRWHETSLLSSTKNWDRVMSNALHIFFNDEMVGNIDFLYHEEIVDCVNPDCSAS